MLPLKLRHQVGGGDVDGHARREGETVSLKRCQGVGQHDSHDRRDTQRSGCQQGSTTALTARERDTGHGHSLWQFVQEHRQEEEETQFARDGKAARDRNPIEEGVEQETDRRALSPAPAETRWVSSPK